MMTKRSNLLACVVFFIISSSCPADSWVLAARKFSYDSIKSSGRTGEVMEGTAKMLPPRILEKITSGLVRSITVDESLARDTHSLQTERESLFLQLSSEIKKRDAIFLSSYSQRELRTKLREQDKKIKEIKDSLQKNLEEQAASEQRLVQSREDFKDGLLQDSDNASEQKSSYFRFFRNLFSSQKSSRQLEEIVLYRNDSSVLFESEQTDSSGLEKAVLAEKINGLICGSFSIYEDYVFLNAELYLFPGGKKIASATEVGTMDDVDFICSSIARQLIPPLTNSMPIELRVSVQPEGADFDFYIDDVLQNSRSGSIIIDSGVHRLQFSAPGCRSVGTSYYFYGNQSYEIQAVLESLQEGDVFLRLKNPVEGDFYTNGLAARSSDDGRAFVSVNGNEILGEFITTDNQSVFFFVPGELALPDSGLVLNTKIFNRSEYVEKRRRRMYVSYSVLVSSLIPLIVCHGEVLNYENAVSYADSIDVSKANAWVTAANISTGLTIGCGAWFIYELVRYLLAANTVLPAQAKSGAGYDPLYPPLDTENIEETAVTVEEEK